MLFDTTFLIHLSGQRGRTARSQALSFLSTHPDQPLYTSRVCWAEFAEGCDSIGQVVSALGEFAIIEIDEPIAWNASRLARDLDGKGVPIGDNDIWIAATALTHALPLVSRNGRHFGRVRGLQVLEY